MRLPEPAGGLTLRRWRDDDAYGHLNNATYYELFDTAVNAHLYEATGVDVRALPEIGVVAETSCRYFRERCSSRLSRSAIPTPFRFSRSR
jgi:hypothetical protein